jgi:hypothetical protein
MEFYDYSHDPIFKGKQFICAYNGKVQGSHELWSVGCKPIGEYFNCFFRFISQRSARSASMTSFPLPSECQGRKADTPPYEAKKEAANKVLIL